MTNLSMNHMFSGSISQVWVLIASCMPVCNVMSNVGPACYCRVLRVGKSCAACSGAELGCLQHWAIAAPSRARHRYGIQWRGQRLGGCCSVLGFSILGTWVQNQNPSSQRMRTLNTSTSVITLLFSWFFWGSHKNVSLPDMLKQSAMPSQGNQRQNADSSAS